VKALAGEVREELVALGKRAEGGRVAVEYEGDVEAGVGLLVEGQQWGEAVHLGYARDRADLIASLVVPAALAAAHSLVSHGLFSWHRVRLTVCTPEHQCTLVVVVYNKAQSMFLNCSPYSVWPLPRWRSSRRPRARSGRTWCATRRCASGGRRWNGGWRRPRPRGGGMRRRTLRPLPARARPPRGSRTSAPTPQEGEPQKKKKKKIEGQVMCQMSQV